MRSAGVSFRAVSAECRTWPTLKHGKYHANNEGESMLALSKHECEKLKIVQLRCQTVREKGNQVMPDDGIFK